MKLSHNNPTRTRVLLGAIAATSAFALVACGGASDPTPSAEETAGEETQDTEVVACDYSSTFPNGPLQLIVPWSAGGGTDAVARLVGNQLAEALDVQVNVVNRTGGAGVVGHQAMVDANPDGQTIGLATAEIAMMHWQGLTEISPESLTSISQVNADQAALTVSADSQWTTAQELIDHITANPGTLVASGTAQGGIGHLAMLGMLMDAGLELDAVTWLPSDGAAPALQELVGGGVDFIVTSSVGEVASMINAGEVVSLAVMADEPDSNFPDVPLLKDETSISYTGGTWRGIVGPLGIDEEIVQELDCNIAQIVESDEFKQFMADSGYSIVYANSADFAAFMNDADSSFGEIMTAAGLAK